MPRGTGKVPDAEHRAVMFACGLVQLNAIPITCNKGVARRPQPQCQGCNPGPCASELHPSSEPTLTWSKVSLPIEAHDPLLLASHKDLVSNFSFGPFTLLQAAQRWGRWGLLLPWE